MSLDDIVNVQISRDAPAVSRAGFGIPLLLGAAGVLPTGWGSDRVRAYTKASAMLDDGFTTSDLAYKMAVAAFAQEFKPTRVLVGRRLTAVAQVDTITPTVVNLFEYTVTINDVEFSFTADADATASEIVAGLIAAINGGTEPVTASGTTTLILTADEAGIPFTAQLSANLAVVHTTANVGIPEDLAAISAINDDWYGLAIASRDADDILAAAAYIETVKKIFIACSSDAAVIAAGSTDVASLLKAKAYARTAYLYSGNQSAYPEAAWLGNMLPQDPGSATYKFKTLAGITADNLSATQKTVAKAKYAGVYTAVGGVNMTEEGVTASGEFIDVIVGIDWLHTNMQADVFQTLLNAPKVPYTDTGVASLEAKVRNRLRLAQVQGILAEDPAPVVIAVPVADVDPGDKAVRRYSGLSFSATLSGAVHSTEITGNVTV